MSSGSFTGVKVDRVVLEWLFWGKKLIREDVLIRLNSLYRTGVEKMGSTRTVDTSSSRDTSLTEEKGCDLLGFHNKKLIHIPIQHHDYYCYKLYILLPGTVSSVHSASAFSVTVNSRVRIGRCY